MKNQKISHCIQIWNCLVYEPWTRDDDSKFQLLNSIFHSDSQGVNNAYCIVRLFIVQYLPDNSDQSRPKIVFLHNEKKSQFYVFKPNCSFTLAKSNTNWISLQDQVSTMLKHIFGANTQQPKKSWLYRHCSILSESSLVFVVMVIVVIKVWMLVFMWYHRISFYLMWIMK